VQFSYIGYIAQNKQVTMGSGSIVLNVTLADDAVLIDDVVVVGYGVFSGRKRSQAALSKSTRNKSQGYKLLHSKQPSKGKQRVFK